MQKKDPTRIPMKDQIAGLQQEVESQRHSLVLLTQEATDSKSVEKQALRQVETLQKLLIQRQEQAEGAKIFIRAYILLAHTTLYEEFETTVCLGNSTPTHTEKKPLDYVMMAKLYRDLS